MGDTQISLQRSTRGREFWQRHWYGIRGSWAAAWATEVERDPLLRDVRMVVDLVFGGGKRYRVSTEPMAFEHSGSGSSTERIATLPILKEEPEISVSYSMGSGSSGARSLSFTIPGIGLSPWEVINSQQRFVAGWAEVSLIAPGMDWSDRFVLMRGDMSSGTSFGSDTEAMTFTVSDPKLSTDLAITEFTVSTRRFAAPPDSFIGQRYPLVVNDPTAIPALRTTISTPPTFLVCYGHEVTVETVYVDGTSYASGSIVHPWTASQLFDLLGTPYTAIVFGSGAGTWEDSTSVHVSVSRSAATSRNVIETMRYLAEEWSLLGKNGISLEAFGRAAGRVLAQAPPAIVINGSGGSNATRALEYIESTICGSYPMISMAWQPSGYGPVVTDRRAPAVAKWWVRSGDLFKRGTLWSETAKDSLFNRFTVRTSYDPKLDTYAETIERDPTTNLLCQISEEQAGPRERSPLESTIIEDDEAATWVADWMVAHLTLPSYLVEYSGPAAILFKYRLGDNIDLIDEEITGCDRDNPIRASIEEIRYKRGSCTVLLRLWPLYQELATASS